MLHTTICFTLHVSPAELYCLSVVLVARLYMQFLFRNPKLSSWAIQRCLPAKATVGFSNMRGPAGQWALAGHPVARIYNGVQPNAFGCFVSLFSYNDTLTFTHTCYASKTDSSEVSGRHSYGGTHLEYMSCRVHAVTLVM